MERGFSPLFCACSGCCAPPVRRRRGRGEAAPGAIPPEPGGVAVGIDTRGGHDDRDRGHGVAVTRPCVKRPSHPPLVGQAIFQLATGRRGVGTGRVWHSAERRSLFGGGQTGQNVKIRPAFPLNETWCSSIVFGGRHSPERLGLFGGWLSADGSTIITAR